MRLTNTVCMYMYKNVNIQCSFNFLFYVVLVYPIISITYAHVLVLYIFRGKFKVLCYNCVIFRASLMDQKLNVLQLTAWLVYCYVYNMCTCTY